METCTICGGVLIGIQPSANGTFMKVACPICPPEGDSPTDGSVNFDADERLLEAVSTPDFLQIQSDSLDP